LFKFQVYLKNTAAKFSTNREESSIEKKRKYIEQFPGLWSPSNNAAPASILKLLAFDEQKRSRANVFVRHVKIFGESFGEKLLAFIRRQKLK